MLKSTCQKLSAVYQQALREKGVFDDACQKFDYGKAKKAFDEIREISFDLCGEEFTLEELRRLPNRLENLKIWSEIGEGNLANAGMMTFLPKGIARILSGHKGRVPLSGLKDIALETAEILGRHEGELYLAGLTSLTGELASALARNKGSLFLSGLEDLSLEAAEALSRHEGRLYLEGISAVKISQEALAALDKHQGTVWMNV